MNFLEKCHSNQSSFKNTNNVSVEVSTQKLKTVTFNDLINASFFANKKGERDLVKKSSFTLAAATLFGTHFPKIGKDFAKSCAATTTLCQLRRRFRDPLSRFLTFKQTAWIKGF